MQNRRHDDRDHNRRYGNDRDRRDDRRGHSRSDHRDFRDGNRDKRTDGDNSRGIRDRGVPKNEKDDKLMSNTQAHRVNVRPILKIISQYMEYELNVLFLFFVSFFL